MAYRDDSLNAKEGGAQPCMHDTVYIMVNFLHEHGHACLFIPKFHCEVNPIERCWAQAKRYHRLTTRRWDWKRAIFLWRAPPIARCHPRYRTFMLFTLLSKVSVPQTTLVIPLASLDT